MSRRLLSAVLLTLVAAVGWVQPATAATPPDLAGVHVHLQTAVSGLDNPVALAWQRGGTGMYVAEQSGHVVLVEGGHVVKTVLNVDVSHGSEQGLLGITFSGDGSKMYGDYTDPNGDSHVAEWTMQGDAPKPGTRRQLLFQKQPYANHNGGQVTIGPDNMLYIAFGDGGSAGDPQGNGQNLGTWLGKILRIDPRPHGTSPYGVPGNNPFVGQVGRRAEIWMYGLRNPWRSSFDRATHDMWIGDVGQDLYEEVDYAPAGSRGQNWGWGDREGFHAYLGRPKPANAKDPILERPHSLGDCAVIGGYVYNGPAIAALRGAYVFGDLCTGELRAVYQTFGTIRSRHDLGLRVSMLSTFGEGPAGELYAVSHGGTVFKIVPNVT